VDLNKLYTSRIETTDATFFQSFAIDLSGAARRARANGPSAIPPCGDLQMLLLERFAGACPGVTGRTGGTALPSSKTRGVT